MLVAGTLSADRASAHAAITMEEAAQPPCHRVMHHAGGLALEPVNACDTICAGSAPESSYETPPLRSEAPLPVLAPEPMFIAPVTHGESAPAAYYGHGPPLLSFYLRNRRLLI